MQQNLFNDENEHYVMGEVLSIYYSNPSNFYKVMLISVNESSDTLKEKELVITGNFGQIQEGDQYKFIGKWTDHPKYGVQFQSSKYLKEKPSSEEAIVAYLSSPRFKGIGKKSAQAVVDHLGVHCIDRILEDESVLDTIPELNSKKRQQLITVLDKEQGMQKIIITLNDFGLSNQLAYKVYQRFEGNTLSTIQKNPYILIEEIEGIGFNRADAIAEEMGIEGDSPERIKAGVLYTLEEQTMKSGDTFVDAEYLLKHTIEILEKSRPFLIDPDKVAEVVIELVEGQSVIKDETRFYLPSLYASEWGIANAFDRLLDGDDSLAEDDKRIDEAIDQFEFRRSITLGESQKKAVRDALKSPVFVLTGGPGTGKTTVLEVIVSVFAELNDLSLDPDDYNGQPFPVLLAAPTGRAAKRMKETTGLPASTIHRLLGLTGSDDEEELQESEKVLKGSLLIIDEMSMVDTWLAYQLLKAVPDGMKVIMVGDKDQLPSVGPGQVLKDILDSQAIPFQELTDIYRQGVDSSIVTLAHEIKKGALPEDFSEKKQDRNFFACSTQKVQDVVTLLVSKAIEKGYTSQQIQILAPIYKGAAGINELNKLLQNLFNPGSKRKKEVKQPDGVYRVGDKVLQLVNDPERNVFNGDMGYIVGIISAKESELNAEELVIDFDGTEVSYPRAEWNKITLAYCCSVHKSQGSEYDMVILPLVFGYGRMLKKDIVYTAITRASQTLLLCGERQAFEKSITEHTTSRKTSLAMRLSSLSEESSELKEDNSDGEQENVEKNTYILTPEAVDSFSIDPMIGMEQCQP
ncbi:SF1B family DNA helicase RecD2 [Alkalibacterium pelagium]|jgi:exodeoxyribonuclease V alpha subunit|uniref:ATP-dependent RecD2 DNA helicase n=1 Tax=Alkalibacterium pelagium TaxID=426702 RepID=A0A1H7GVM8_9LACT|nr:ATP-dependent RecD-like DNA helicase [Alkalibacterium pelagium]GEN49738.1 ATP-dependent RecD-like DNA helicase [Alkalibacterium pelagium]SEK39925.1 exodeoxyribonuclease V alpha subunit [Alkalibacterium pelagium]